MTKRMEQAIEALGRLPVERQDEPAEYVLTLEERQAVEEGLAQADAGRFVDATVVEALFFKHRLARG